MATASAVMLALIGGCSPAAEKPAAAAPVAKGVDAITPRNPFFGTWGIEAAKIAPWWDHKGAEPAPDPAMATISFEADKSTGSKLLTCDKPRYAVNMVTERTLFEGNLPDPPKDAAALGFATGGVTQMTFTCASGTADVSLDFPMIDDDTIALGLDNIIYTFKRTGG